MIVAQRYDPAVLIDSIGEHPLNPRRGDETAIEASIDAHGFYGAVIVQESSRSIIAGNHRHRMLKRGGDLFVPVMFLDVDDEEALRILLNDNQTSDSGTYDSSTLVGLLSQLSETAAGFAGTGFAAGDLSDLMAQLAAAEPETSTPDVIEVDYAPAITVPGDLWLLGPHRLLCGSSRDEQDVTRLLAGAKINLAFTSPPYAEQRVYDPGSGFTPIKPDEYVEWFAAVAANVAANLTVDGSWFVNIKTSADGLDTSLYVFDLVIAHVREWGWHFATEFCWERNGVPKSVTRRFKNNFEPIYQFARGEWKMRPDEVRHPSDNVPINVGPGGGNTSWQDAQGNGFAAIGAGRKKRRNGSSSGMSKTQGQNTAPGEYTEHGMAYPSNRLPTFNGSHDATGHTAAFPVGLPEWFIRAYTDAGDNVFDPFMGSGSTLLAAHNQSRVGFGTEISKGYCDIICKRFQLTTGIKPVLESTGQSHDFAAAATDPGHVLKRTTLGDFLIGQQK